MKRRTFLKLLGVAGWGLFAPVRLVPSRPVETRPLLRCHVAGLQYHDGVDLSYRSGEALTLRREPHNRYDANAIAIYRGDLRIGYLPRRLNPTPARRMDCGTPLHCRITAYTPDAPTWERVKVEVYEEIE